jgi:predicted 2-oxoglutarate/Fe(II)-dependent dioxygenase YbiX
MPAADFFTLFRFFVRKEFLSKELCAGLRREIAASAHNPATIRSHGSVYTVDLSFRKVKSAEVSSATSSRTESCLLDLKPQIEKHFQLSLSGCQSPQFLEYLPGPKQ